MEESEAKENADLKQPNDSEECEDETSPAWSILIPPEVLRMLFETLIASHDKDKSFFSEFKLKKQYLLNCRGTHPRWKLMMDKLLEEKCLATWKDHCDLSMKALCEAKHPFNLAHIQLITSQRGCGLEWILYPPAFGEGESSPPSNPFPAKSLTLAFESRIEPTETDRFTSVTKFFSLHGHHLTSLVISSVNVQLVKLQKILESTPHLKALTLQNLNFHKIYDVPSTWESTADDPYFPPLPELSELQHLRIFKGHIAMNVGNSFETLYDRLMYPYKSQLLSLDADHLDSVIDPSTFPKLTRLSVWSGGFMRSLAPRSFPLLQCFQLGNFELKYGPDEVTLQKIQGYLAHFSETLVELTLDFVDVEGIIEPEPGGSFMQNAILLYSSNEEDNQLKWSTTRTSFSKLKTLSIYYPGMFPEEVVVLKNMLRALPNLENLHFLRVDEHWRDRGYNYNWSRAIDHRKSEMRWHVRDERYQDICPRLKKITARMEIEKEAFFTKIYNRENNENVLAN